MVSDKEEKFNNIDTKTLDSVVSAFDVVSTVSVFVDGDVDVSAGNVVWPTVSSNVVIAGMDGFEPLILE
jgi:hypothetical protein